MITVDLSENTFVFLWFPFAGSTPVVVCYSVCKQSQWKAREILNGCRSSGGKGERERERGNGWVTSSLVEWSVYEGDSLLDKGRVLCQTVEIWLIQDLEITIKMQLDALNTMSMDKIIRTWISFFSQKSTNDEFTLKSSMLRNKRGRWTEKKG